MKKLIFDRIWRLIWRVGRLPPRDRRTLRPLSDCLSWIVFSTKSVASIEHKYVYKHVFQQECLIDEISYHPWFETRDSFYAWDRISHNQDSPDPRWPLESRICRSSWQKTRWDACRVSFQCALGKVRLLHGNCPLSVYPVGWENVHRRDIQTKRRH